MSTKKINDLLNELKETNNKINDDSTVLEDSLELFEKSKKIISEIEDKLNNVEGVVKKIVDNNGSKEDFKMEK